MRNRLIELITTAIARCCVMRERGEKVDEAAVIADMLLSAGVIVPIKGVAFLTDADALSLERSEE